MDTVPPQAGGWSQTVGDASRWPLGADGLDTEPMISPALFEIERERVFKRVWLKVGRVEEIPAPGDYKVKRLDVARTSAILVRGRDGAIRAFHNICPHRGNKVIPETGNETFGRARGNVMSCRFHGWVFATDGAVRSIPREANFGGIDKSCLGLRPIHCELWEGFIFVNLDDAPRQTLTDYLGGIGRHFAGYPYGEATTTYRYQSLLKCNWKIALYAFTEGYHVPTIHAGTFPSLASLEQTAFRLFGPHSTSTLYVPPVPGLQPTPATALFGKVLKTAERHAPHMNDLPPDINPTRRGDFQFEFPTFFPNLVLHLAAGNGYPGIAFFTHQFWPIAPDLTLWEGTNYFRPPRNMAERVAMAHVVALHRNGWLEDTSTMEDSHEALSSGVLKQMVLMDEELMPRNTHVNLQRYMETA